MQLLTHRTLTPARLNTESALLALLVGEDQQKLELVAPANHSLTLEALNVKGIGFKAKFGEIQVINQQGRLVVLVGKGNGPLTAERWRYLGGAIGRAAKEHASLGIGFAVEAEHMLPFFEGVHLGALADYSLKSKTQQPALAELLYASPNAVSPSDLQNINNLVSAVSSTRELVNTPANLLFPDALAKRTQALSKGTSVKVEIWDVPRLEKEKCAGILAVGVGSSRPPRLIKLEYRPRGAKKHLALVGKGITFDTGGLSLKPREGMAGMKYDMTGAATVLNVLIAASKLNLKINLTAWMCVAENMPSGSATRPNDVIIYRNGKSVEVMNTDAEGRLVLADGLILAAESKPDLIVDVATLTGAATVALGKRYSAVLGNQAGTELLMKAFAASGEAAWLMPMAEELRELLDSPIADLANAKLGNATGGTIVGAHFLAEFIPTTKDGNQIPWAHIDLAGPANNDGQPYGYVPKGATGYGVRTLVELARILAQ